MFSQSGSAGVVSQDDLAESSETGLRVDICENVLAVSSRTSVLLLGSFELISQCNWEKSASCDLRECTRRSRKNLLFFSSISSLISPSVPFIPANLYNLK